MYSEIFVSVFSMYNEWSLSMLLIVVNPKAVEIVLEKKNGFYWFPFLKAIPH